MHVPALAVYRDRRMLTILMLGFSSGLPLALTGATLSVWLHDAGLDKANIGLFALAGIPYTLKFLWAPLVDRLWLPGLTRRFGRRRAWALATQAALMAALVGMAGCDPATMLPALAAMAFLVAVCSASQDIVVDAYRVEALDQPQFGAGSAVYVLGYRFGMLASGAGGLYLASVLSWPEVYTVMAALVVVGIVTILASPEPDVSAAAAALADDEIQAAALVRRSGLSGWRARATTWLYGAVVAPFRDFMGRPAWLAVLLFIVLFKLGEVYAGVMAMPFYQELGFTKVEIASVTKVFGLIATIAGGLIGGVLIGWLGIVRGLLATGVLQMVSNLCFMGLAAIGHDVGALMVTVAVENVCGGMATAAFVAYLSSLCTVAYTATQYALLTSLSAFARQVLAAPSGWCVDQLGWTSYYLFTMVLCLPGLALLMWLLARPVPVPARAESAG